MSKLRGLVFPAVVAAVFALFVVLVETYLPGLEDRPVSPPPTVAQPVPQGPPPVAPPPQPRPSELEEHPLVPVLRWAHESLRGIERLHDYSAVMIKGERLDNSISYERLFLKIRHRPFSVYALSTAPECTAGREVNYVEGQNNGRLWAHGVGAERALGTVSLPPNGPIAMRGQRHPITAIGILNLTRRLIEVAEQDLRHDECQVSYFGGADVNGRSCTCIQVVHPVPREHFLFYLAKVYVDNELNLPIRYESYGWPQSPDGSPPLIEQYIYLDLSLNNGFTDNDFSIRNPNYQFR